MFEHSRTSTKDERRSGRPVEATIPEIIDKIHDRVLSDRWIKVREMFELTGILQGTVFSILHEKFGVKKISARWMPRLLSAENKRNRVVDSEAILALFRHNSDEFLRRCITVYETWIHHYTPETKEQSKQWVFEGEQAPKKAKAVILAGRWWPRFFGIHVESSTPITWKRTNGNCSVLCVVIARIERRNQEKTSSFEKEKILFH